MTHHTHNERPASADPSDSRYRELQLEPLSALLEESLLLLQAGWTSLARDKHHAQRNQVCPLSKSKSDASGPQFDLMIPPSDRDPLPQNEALLSRLPGPHLHVNLNYPADHFY